MREKSFDREIHCKKVDVLMSPFADTKTKQTFLESWWPGTSDSRVGLDNNLSLRWSSCMICVASNFVT